MQVQPFWKQVAAFASSSACSNIAPEHHVLVVVGVVHGQPVLGHRQPTEKACSSKSIIGIVPP